MKKFYVYIHTCPNGKKYVGATTQKPEYRWNRGKSYLGSPLQKDVERYGWDSFSHEVFEVNSEEEMFKKETELINTLHTTDPKHGYNRSLGKGSTGCHPKRTEEQKKHLSQVRTGKHYPHKGVSRSLNCREKLSKAHKQLEHPQLTEKLTYLLPSGETKLLRPSHAKRWYINRGINITLTD